MLLPIAIGVYILIALILVVSLLLNGVRPSKTLAWLLAIFTIPVAGVLLYILFGRNRRKSKMFSSPVCPTLWENTFEEISKQMICKCMFYSFPQTSGLDSC